MKKCDDCGRAQPILILMDERKWCMSCFEQRQKQKTRKKSNSAA